MDIALVIGPGNPEVNDPFRLYQTLLNSGASIFGVLIHHRRDGVDNFLNSLVKFSLAGILVFNQL